MFTALTQPFPPNKLANSPELQRKRAIPADIWMWPVTLYGSEVGPVRRGAAHSLRGGFFALPLSVYFTAGGPSPTASCRP